MIPAVSIHDAFRQFLLSDYSEPSFFWVLMDVVVARLPA